MENITKIAQIWDQKDKRFFFAWFFFSDQNLTSSLSIVLNLLPRNLMSPRIHFEVSIFLPEIYQEKGKSFTSIFATNVESRGKSLLESWRTTFLPDWQPPLIFVWFISNFLRMCSNSMASVHVILKLIRQRLRVAVSQKKA